MVPYYVLILVIYSVLNAKVQGDGMSVVKEWKTVDFNFPSNSARQNAITSGRYVPKNVAILDVDVYESPAQSDYSRGHSNKRIFVTTPKFQTGIPVSLSTLASKLSSDGSPLLEPFPDWASHKEGNCDGLTSIYRVQIDECGRLWVLDTGKLETFTSSPRRICRPQLIVYDLNNRDKIIARHRFPDAVLDASSLFVTVAVDTRDDQCYQQYAYIADVTGYKMVVFNALDKQSWRVNSNFFYPFPPYGTFNITGTQFDLMDGLFGIALGPIVNNDRKVFFHSLASVKEGWTMASTLLNETNFDGNLVATRLFQISENDRSSQSTSEVMSDDGILFFPELSSNSLACWNSKTTFKKENFETLYKNDEMFQFPSGMKLIKNNDLFILTSRLQKYIAGTTDINEVNYRILTAPIGELTKKTQCEVTRFAKPSHKEPSTVNNIHSSEDANKPGLNKKPSGYGQNVNNHASGSGPYIPLQNNGGSYNSQPKPTLPPNKPFGSMSYLQQTTKAPMISFGYSSAQSSASSSASASSYSSHSNISPLGLPIPSNPQPPNSVYNQKPPVATSSVASSSYSNLPPKNDKTTLNSLGVVFPDNL